MTPRAVLFDLGGTLVEAPPAPPGTRLAAALGLADAPAQAHVITALVHRTVFPSPAALAERLRSELGLADDPTAAVAAVWEAEERAAKALHGAATCVAAVHAVGAKIAIVANVWSPGAAALRGISSAISPLIDHAHLSCETGSVKPSAAAFHGALDALGVKPADAIVVGDDLAEDVEPALALGMSAVWLRRDAADPGGVVTVDPHAAPVPIPVAVVPEGARVARTLFEVRRIVLTWLWAARGPHALTAPVAV
jgi:FMN hydrolase / 5-amino-6-(5-phospho-D-ribitylamino)uracil phosphatase